MSEKILRLMGRMPRNAPSVSHDSAVKVEEPAEAAAKAAVAAAVEDLQNKKRMKKAALVKLGAMCVFLGVAVVFMTISWFTMSSEVSNGNLSMSASGDLYSIGTIGNTVGSYDSKYWNDAIQNSGCTGAATWLLSEESNMRNYQVGELKEEERGIKPGTSGKVSFLLYPNQNMSAAFKYKLYAFTVDFDNEGEEIENTFSLQDDDTVNTLLNGHILLFTGRSGNETDGFQYSGLVTSSQDLQRITPANSYSVNSIGNEIELFWVWPETLAQIVLSPGNINLRGRKSIASSDLRAYFKLHPEYFLFDCPAENIALIKAQETDIEEFIDDAYAKYSKMYNEADQEIGTKVNYVLLDMKVDTSV